MKSADIAHTGYHKHSAYILENADMPGFSRKEQTILAQLVIGHRGDLKKMADIIGNNEIMWCAVLSLRLAALFCRSRLPLDLPPQTQLRVDENNHSFILRINAQWLEQHPSSPMRWTTKARNGKNRYAFLGSSTINRAPL